MDLKSVTAFCPGHISGYFRRIEGTSVAATGSIGAGIVIDEGVTSTVTNSDHVSVSVLRRDKFGTIIEKFRRSPPVEYILDRMGVTVSVTTECHLPIGAGFGLSAAALLSTVTAANHITGLGLTTYDIAALAHEAEVLHRTGLGDVAACQAGGRVVRQGPGIDGTIHRFYDLDLPLAAVSFGPISTPAVLGSPVQMERVTAAFPDRTPVDATDFFTLSQDFARASGLLTREAGAVITKCTDNKVFASMTMLGNGVFAYGQNAEHILSSFGEVYEFSVARNGPRICRVEQ